MSELPEPLLPEQPVSSPAPVVQDPPAVPIARISPTAAVEHILWFHLHRSQFSGGQTIPDKILLAVVKTLRLPLAVPPDFPCVRTLAPFAVTRDSLAAHEWEAVAATVAKIQHLGFGEPLYHLVPQPLMSCTTLYLTMAHSAGRGIARITVNFLPLRKTPLAYNQFYSVATDGGVLLTWSRGMDLTPPPGWEPQTCPQAEPAALWAQHQQRLSGRALRTITDADLAQTVETLQHGLVTHQLACGVMRPLTAAERERYLAQSGGASRATTTSGAHSEVMAEIAKLQTTKRNSWTSFILILLVSMGLFIGSMHAQGGFDWTFLLLLMGVLLFHEIGHYVAMKLSGYRNLKMFFIPFLGAAVSGQSYNVAGWKRTIVSLAGPLPGIALGMVICVVGLVMDRPELQHLALLLLVINGMNLLPILPLDGGWVAHQLLFSRHPWLDLVFRIVAVAGLLGLSIMLKTKVLMFVAIFVAIGIPLAFRLARITSTLRREGLHTRSDDDQTIPQAVAEPIIERIKAAHPTGIAPQLAAQHTLAIFDSLNSRPPGWFISCLFLGTQGTALLLAVAFSVLASVGMHGGLAALRHAFNRGVAQAQQDPTQRMPHTVAPTTIQSVVTPPTAAPATVTLVATLKDHHAAATLAYDLAATLPPDSGCVVFGDSLLVSLAHDEPRERERVYGALAALDPEAFACTAGDQLALSLSTTHPGAASSITELRTYFGCPQPERLIPPWAAADGRTAEQRERDGLHRRISQQILQASQKGLITKRGIALRTAARAADKRGDKAKATALTSELEQANQEDYLAQLARLEQQQPTTTAMITACRALATQVNKPTFISAYQAAVTPYLGLLSDGDHTLGFSFGFCFINPSDDALNIADDDELDLDAEPNQPPPPAATQPAAAEDRSFDLVIHCAAPLQTPPAIVTWLTAQGFKDLHYEIQRNPAQGASQFDQDDDTTTGR